MGEGVLDETRVYSAEEAGLVIGRQAGNLDFDGEFAKTRGGAKFLGVYRNTHGQAKPMSFQIAGGVVSGAGSQRDEEELGRSGALIGASVGKRLVTDDPVPAHGSGEFRLIQVLNSYFHRVSSRSGRERLPIRKDAKAGPK